VPTAHCVSTIDGVILAVDQGFLDLVGRSEPDVISRSYRDITDPRDLGKSAGMLASLVDRAPPVRLRKRYLRPDGTSVAANLLVTRFDDPDRLVSTLFWSDGTRDLPPVRLWEAALQVRHVHSVRQAEFGIELSTDPVGSILVGIYLAEAEGRIITLEELAGEVGIAPSTALRWLKVLQQRNLVDGGYDAIRGLQFTHVGVQKMEKVLASVYRITETVFLPA
jgi:PAS domain S-box-containing protein